MLLVDIFLKDVTQHVRVDLIVVAQRALVQVPLIPFEEVKQPLKGRILDLNRRAKLRLDLVMRFGYGPDMPKSFRRPVAEVILDA